MFLHKCYSLQKEESEREIHTWKKGVNEESGVDRSYDVHMTLHKSWEQNKAIEVKRESIYKRVKTIRDLLDSPIILKCLTHL